MLFRSVEVAFMRTEPLESLCRTHRVDELEPVWTEWNVAVTMGHDQQHTLDFYKTEYITSAAAVNACGLRETHVLLKKAQKRTSRSRLASSVLPLVRTRIECSAEAVSEDSVPGAVGVSSRSRGFGERDARSGDLLLPRKNVLQRKEPLRNNAQSVMRSVLAPKAMHLAESTSLEERAQRRPTSARS